jgi:hypothetical protein
MSDFVNTVRPNELVNLAAIEAIFIKNPPAVDMNKLGRTKEEIDANVARIAKTFKVVARGSSTYVLFEGTLEQCRDYVEELFKQQS